MKFNGKNFWKFLLVYIICFMIFDVFIGIVLDFDFQMSGWNFISIFTAISISVYLGYMPNKIINKTRNDKKKKTKRK